MRRGTAGQGLPIQHIPSVGAVCELGGVQDSKGELKTHRVTPKPFGVSQWDAGAPKNLRWTPKSGGVEAGLETPAEDEDTHEARGPSKDEGRTPQDRGRNPTGRTEPRSRRPPPAHNAHRPAPRRAALRHPVGVAWRGAVAYGRPRWGRPRPRGTFRAFEPSRAPH